LIRCDVCRRESSIAVILLEDDRQYHIGLNCLSSHSLKDNKPFFGSIIHFWSGNDIDNRRNSFYSSVPTFGKNTIVKFSFAVQHLAVKSQQPCKIRFTENPHFKAFILLPNRVYKFHFLTGIAYVEGKKGNRIEFNGYNPKENA